MTKSAKIHCQLWMGGLEPYMTESFVMSAFQRMGEQPQNVKVMRNKYTGEPAGYCFIHFVTDEAALNAMHKLNGKIIPNSQPPVRFMLNHASTGAAGRAPVDREFSLWVGDLTPEVDDYSLYRQFATRFPSVRTAKVILDNAGFSKGYGFIRFASEDEQKSCLVVMNGYKGLGGKPLKISNAVPKSHRFPGSSSPSATGASASGAANPAASAYGTAQDYSQYYDPSSYWSNYSAWQGYYDTSADPSAAYHAQPDYSQMAAYDMNGHAQDTMELVDHCAPVDIEKLNRELIERDYNMWDALEVSRWMPIDGMECRYQLDFEKK